MDTFGLYPVFGLAGGNYCYRAFPHDEFGSLANRLDLRVSPLGFNPQPYTGFCA